MKKHLESSGCILIPYNPTKYDLEKAIALFPYIEWHQSCRPEIGGSVYLYVGKSGGKDHSQQLAYEFEVIETDVMPTIDDSCCAKVPMSFSWNDKCLRMKLVRRIPSGLITLDDLLCHGLSKYPQGQMKVPFELQKYIQEVLSRAIK